MQNLSSGCGSSIPIAVPMSENNLKYFVCIDIFAKVTKDLEDDTLIAVSCIQMVFQSGIPGAVVVLVKIIMVDNMCLAVCS